MVKKRCGREYDRSHGGYREKRSPAALTQHLPQFKGTDQGRYRDKQGQSPTAKVIDREDQWNADSGRGHASEQVR